MKDTEIVLVENILKNHNIKNSNELSARLNEIDNDKNIIRGLQKALNQRDKSIFKNADKITMLRAKTNKKTFEIESTKSLALNDKFKLLNEIKSKDEKIAILERALSNVFRRAYFEELEELDYGMHIMTEKEYVEMHKKWAIGRAEKELKEQK